MSSYATKSLRARSRTFRARYDRLRNAIKNRWLYLDDTYGIQYKLSLAFSKTVDVIFTGAIIWYAIEYHNFISYGLLSALATYYFDYVVRSIKA